MNTLIDNVRLWTGENAIDNACIQIKDTRIAYAGARAAAPEFAADTIIDGKGGIALPGLVNAHTHLPMTLVRGVGTAATVFNPGSLRDGGSYGVVTITNGECSFTWKRVPEF